MENFNAGDVLIIKNSNKFVLRKKDGTGGYIETKIDLDPTKIHKIKQNAEKRGIRVEYNYDPQDTEFNYKIIDNAKDCCKSYDSESSISDASDDSDDEDVYEEEQVYGEPNDSYIERTQYDLPQRNREFYRR